MGSQSTDIQILGQLAAGCKIALLPKLLPIFDDVGQYSRDVGEWLPIAEKAEYVNEYCVRDRQMGGLDEVGESERSTKSSDGSSPRGVGSTRRLLILLYEPGSQQDQEIEEERRETGMATMRSIGIDFSAAWGTSAWSGFGMSDGESEASLQDDFAQFLNIDEGERHARARAGQTGASAVSRVGAADPHIRYIADGWVLDYISVTGCKPVEQAAPDLARFYKHIVDVAAGKIASGTPSAKSHGFHSDALSLKLNSADAISWEWIISFARAMSRAADAMWPVLYQAIANSRHWDKAQINVALVGI
ncbi:MAG: hypothetical protein Q9171_005805 [Xanthocarpia ochracea]